MKNVYNWKVFLAEIMNLRLGDLPYLSILEEIPEEKRAGADEKYLIDFFESIENNINEPDDKRLVARMCYVALSTYILDMEAAGEEEKEEIKESQLLDYKDMSLSQQRTVDKKLKKKYSSWAADDVLRCVEEYIWKCYPEFVNGYNLHLMRDAREKFWKHEGIDNKFAIGWEFTEKVNKAFDRMEDDIKTKFIERIEKEKDKWAAEFLEWLNNNNVRCSKSALKTYLADKNLRMNDDLLTRIMFVVNRIRKESEVYNNANTEELVRQWTSDFLLWADEHHAKYTKTSMKVFFRERNIKVSEVIMDGMKDQLRR